MMSTKMSPEEVCAQLRLDGIVIDPSTIHRWTDHYSRIIILFSNTLRLDAGFQWHVDELYFKIRGQSRLPVWRHERRKAGLSFHMRY